MAFEISNQWTSIFNLTGFLVGEPINIQNAGRAGDLLELVISIDQPSDDERGYVVRSLDPMFRITGQSSDVWIRYIRYDINCTITPRDNARCLANISNNEQITTMDSYPVESLILQERIMLLDVLSGLAESTALTLDQIRLLNARYEEATETNINLEDIKNANSGC